MWNANPRNLTVNPTPAPRYEYSYPISKKFEHSRLTKTRRERIRNFEILGSHKIDRSVETSLEHTYIATMALNSSTSASTAAQAFRPILVRDGQPRRSLQTSSATSSHCRSVHFDARLNWKDEDERSQRGQALRKQMRQRLLVERGVRFQQYRDRKRAFDVFQSNDDWTRSQVHEMLRDDASSNHHQLYTRGLEAMLQSLGAPSTLLGDVGSTLEWFRNSPHIRYTKHLRCECEFVDTYLLFLGRAELFQKKFVAARPPHRGSQEGGQALLQVQVQQATNHATPPPPRIPTVASLTNGPSPSCFNPTTSTMDCSSISSPRNEETATPYFQHEYTARKASSSFWNKEADTSSTTPSTFHQTLPFSKSRRAGGSIAKFRRAFQLVWYAMIRRRRRTVRVARPTWWTAVDEKIPKETKNYYDEDDWSLFFEYDDYHGPTGTTSSSAGTVVAPLIVFSGSFT
jgi:hypothetical protein